jgi:hypothetical protein
MTFTHNREWLRELRSFIFVFAVERCSLPAPAGNENKNNGHAPPPFLEHEQKKEGSACLLVGERRGEVRRVATHLLAALP